MCKSNRLSFQLGYQLCDNSVGVLFNDSTRLIMYNDGDSLQYIEQNNTESYFTVRSCPSALNKKVSSEDRSPCWWVAVPGETSAGLVELCCKGGHQGKNICNLGYSWLVKCDPKERCWWLSLFISSC